jgi:hypothetical protein
MSATIKTPRIVGVGAVFIDDIVLPSGKTHMAQLGGGVVHAMMGAAIWGEKPGITAVIGQDLPHEAREKLERYLDTMGLCELNVPQMRAWQIFETDGTRRELYRVEHIAPFIAGAHPKHLPTAYEAAGEGFYLLQDFDGIRAWRKKLTGLVLWEPLQLIMIHTNRDQLGTVLRECTIDVISPNLVEAQAIYGDLSPEDLIQTLFEDGAHIVALRMGARGSIIASKTAGELHYIPAIPIKMIIDQTGAGNTYCGGLLWGLIEGKQLREAGAAGSVSASFCLEQIGVIDPAQVNAAERDRRFTTLLGER